MTLVVINQSSQRHFQFHSIQLLTTNAECSATIFPLLRTLLPRQGSPAAVPNSSPKLSAAAAYIRRRTTYAHTSLHGLAAYKNHESWFRRRPHKRILGRWLGQGVLCPPVAAVTLDVIGPRGPTNHQIMVHMANEETARSDSPTALFLNKWIHSDGPCVGGLRLWPFSRNLQYLLCQRSSLFILE